MRGSNSFCRYMKVLRLLMYYRLGVDQKFTPTVTILKDGESECFRLPNELSEWACNVVGMIAMGMNLFPTKVTFSNINGRYYVDIL